MSDEVERFEKDLEHARKRFITALKIHKTWADRWSIVSLVLAVSLMVAAATLGEMAEADAATRTGVMVVMATVVIVVCIWQAAGRATAHIHELILDQRDAATFAR